MTLIPVNTPRTSARKAQSGSERRNAAQPNAASEDDVATEDAVFSVVDDL